jgi:hypothetical protein
MRYAIKQINTDRELWLVRATHKGVWGKSERAFGFFRRPTAERWVTKLCRVNPGLCLEIVEVLSRVEAMDRESAAASSAEAYGGELESEPDIEALPEPQAA